MQLGRGFKISHAKVIIGRVKANRSIFGNMNDCPFIACSVKGQAGEVQLSQRKTKCAACVGLLNTTCKRTLAADARTVGVGEVCAGKWSGREYQRIVR